jgi:serine/threonine-protein kinase RsbW
MKFEILSDPANLKIVRQKVRIAVETFNPEYKDIDALILAIDEAVQNIIRYAYEMDKTKKITFEVYKSDHAIVFEIRDFGKQAPIEKIKSRDLEDVKPGGLGVHFIKSIAKEVDYIHQKDDDGGTKLILKF